MKILVALLLHGLTFAVAIALAAVADLAMATAGGYRLRAEPVALAIADAVLIALPVGIAFAITVFARDRAWTRPLRPSTTVAIAVGVPAAVRLVPFLYAESGRGAVMALSAGVLVAVALALRLRSRATPPKSERSTATALGGIAALLALALVSGTALGFWIANRPPPGMDEIAPRSAASSAAADSESGAARAHANVLLIVLDTVRADRLGFYGASRSVSPFLDSLAKESIVFDQAIASSSYTLPTHATLFTGLHPSHHGAAMAERAGISLSSLGRQDDQAQVAPLAAEATTLAEVLQTSGYETGAICANTAYLHRPFGLDQGFDTYVDALPNAPAARPVGLELGYTIKLVRWFWPFRRLFEGNERYYLQADTVNALARAWLAPRGDRPFFLFLNYMDAHGPYLPVGDYQFLFPYSDHGLRPDNWAIRSGMHPISEEAYRATTDAYDAELRFLDDRLAELFGHLDERALLDSTWVVIVADHGESFGEHQQIGHAGSLYQTEIRVPLLIRPPGGTAGRRVAETVHQADVMPTLLAELGLSIPADLDGVPLALDGSPTPRKTPILSRLGPYQYDFEQQAIYQDGWKLIHDSRGRSHLYYLPTDPDEDRDLAEAEPERREALLGALRTFQENARPRFEGQALDLDQDARDRLEALGYGK